MVSISFISRWTNAVRSVVVDLTNSIDATLVVIDTWVLALLTDTCSVDGTIAVYCTLWLADDEWVTLEARRTGAETPVSRRSRDGILTTRIGVTRVHHNWIWSWWEVTLNQSIANVPW